MTGSAPTPDFRGWFIAQRHEPAADGFTENLMRRLPHKTPLLPALVAAVSVAAGLLICAVTVSWASIANNLLHAAATVSASVPAVTLWLKAAATGSVLRYAAVLRELLPTLAAWVGALYLVMVAGLAILASTLKPRIY